MLIEAIPDGNKYINTEPPDPEPPEGFVDSTVYRYKYDPSEPDGTGELKGAMPAFPEGWEEAQANKKGRISMVKSREDREEKVAQAKESPEGTITEECPAEAIVVGEFDFDKFKLDLIGFAIDKCAKNKAPDNVILAVVRRITHWEAVS